MACIDPIHRHQPTLCSNSGIHPPSIRGPKPGMTPASSSLHHLRGRIRSRSRPLLLDLSGPCRVADTVEIEGVVVNRWGRCFFCCSAILKTGMAWQGSKHWRTAPAPETKPCRASRYPLSTTPTSWCYLVDLDQDRQTIGGLLPISVLSSCCISGRYSTWEGEVRTD